MSKLLKILTMLLLPAAFIFGGHRDAHATTSYWVYVSMACETEFMEGLYEKIHTKELKNRSLEPEIQAGICASFMPLQLQVEEILDGPKKDSDGDVVYLVKIGEGLAVFAWPNFNSNILLPQTISI